MFEHVGLAATLSPEFLRDLLAEISCSPDYLRREFERSAGDVVGILSSLKWLVVLGKMPARTSPAPRNEVHGNDALIAQRARVATC